MKINRIILLILFSVIFSISSLFGGEPKLGRKIFDDGKYPQPMGNTGKISFLKYGHNENGRLQYEFVIADPKTGEVNPFDLELKEPPPYGSLVWSKDASKIAVVRKDLTVCDIYTYSATKPFKINKITDLTPYVAALDSIYADKHKLTPDMYLNVAWMDWSYDDSKIAFSMIGLQKSAVWVLDVATGKLRQITEEQFGASPCWSPDGKTIYMSGLGESSGKLSQDIYKMNMADYSVEPLINTKDTELYPDVTPDGKYLVYARMPDGGKQTIYVYDIQNNKSAQLVYLGPNQSAAYPVWSSDGKSVIYQLIEPGNTYPDLYQIDFDPNIFN
jgi:Tol biopolymer transport system component